MKRSKTLQGTAPCVRVVFKKDKKTGEIVAVLPEGKGGSLMVSCYTHEGQHSACSVGYLLTEVVSANESEYRPLLEEMRSLYRETTLLVGKRLPDYRRL